MSERPQCLYSHMESSKEKLRVPSNVSSAGSVIIFNSSRCFIRSRLSILITSGFHLVFTVGRSAWDAWLGCWWQHRRNLRGDSSGSCQCRRRWTDASGFRGRCSESAKPGSSFRSASSVSISSWRSPSRSKSTEMPPRWRPTRSRSPKSIHPIPPVLKPETLPEKVFINFFWTCNWKSCN